MCSVEITLTDELSNDAPAQLEHLLVVLTRSGSAVDHRASTMRAERIGDDW